MDMSASVEFSIEPRDATRIVPRQNQISNPAHNLTLNNSNSFSSKQNKKQTNKSIIHERKANNFQENKQDKSTLSVVKRRNSRNCRTGKENKTADIAVIKRPRQPDLKQKVKKTQPRVDCWNKTETKFKIPP